VQAYVFKKKLKKDQYYFAKKQQQKNVVLRNNDKKNPNKNTYKYHKGSLNLSVLFDKFGKYDFQQRQAKKM
jgi:hypothetical protein